jgi:tRNA threonylcarbamoyladenosine biosynthesis protein TsaB
MAHYLALSNNYETVQVALFQDHTPIAQDTIAKTEASKSLIPVIDTLLKSQQCTLSDISCIIANNGPGPFTTLRVVITTVNGISYATGISLIGINALHAAAHEWYSDDYPALAVLFNAFGNDLYARIQHKQEVLFEGVASVEKVVQLIADLTVPTLLLGNGVALHRNQFDQAGDFIHIPEKIPAYCSIETIAQLGITQWETTHQGVKQLLPYYFKKHPVQQ